MFSHVGFEYLYGIEDAFDDPLIREASLKKSGQTAGTTAALNYIGKTIDRNPSGWLIVYPTEMAVKRFSKRKLGPMIRDCAVLRHRVKDSSKRNEVGDIYEKTFPGGFVSMVSAKSLSSLSAQSTQRILIDELNRIPYEAGNEGDTITIIRKRIQGFKDTYKLIKISTPTEKGISQISEEFERSDQRYYFVPCPHCGKTQTLRFENLHWEKSIELNSASAMPQFGEDDTYYLTPEFRAFKWVNKKFVEISYKYIHSLKKFQPVTKHGKTHYPSTAYYRCENPECSIQLNDREDKRYMVANGNWIAQNPLVTDHAGFFLNELYSPLSTFEYVVRQFVDAFDNYVKLKSFVNLVLGEDWENPTKKILDSNQLMLRCEHYGPKLPEGVIILTIGGDIQDNRVELVVKGWGIGQESWLIDYHVIPGDFDYEDVKQLVDLYLSRTYEHTHGAVLQISAASIDMLGHKTQSVLEFTNRRKHRHIYAVYGKAGEGIPVFNIKASKTEDDKYEYHRVGTDAAKELIYSRLSLTSSEDGKFGPGYMHFPTEIKINKETGKGEPLTPEYFEMLTAEKLVTVKDKNKWEKIRARNEGLDCEVYAFAAFLSLRLNDEDLLRIQDSIKNYQYEFFDKQPEGLIFEENNFVNRGLR